MAVPRFAFGGFRVRYVTPITATLLAGLAAGAPRAADGARVPAFPGAEGSVTISAGARSAVIALTPRASAADNGVAVVSLVRGAGYFIGCPSRSLIVIQR